MNEEQTVVTDNDVDEAQEILLNNKSRILKSTYSVISLEQSSEIGKDDL